MNAIRALYSSSIALIGLACATAQAAQGSYAQLERGRYLTRVGDCEACHTAPGGQPFAGGRAMQTPFGTIYTPNITSDAVTGIGAWTDQQFYRAMHDGIDAEGEKLYPAFPYPWFTHTTREDVDAIRAYLRSLPAVRASTPANDLMWPLGHRGLMTAWNSLYFDAGTLKPDSNKGEQWNRGAYLVEGLGHCGACHTPTNFLGASKKDDRFEGGELANWYSPNLKNDARQGLGSWSEDDIVEFLKTGRTARAVAYGPMSDVIEHSTRYWTESDLRAAAVYLKSLSGSSDSASGNELAADVATTGEAIYMDTCSACHHKDGQGVPHMFPALARDPIVQSQSPTTIVRLILNGGRGVATQEHPTPVSMPSYGWKLSDAQVAAVASYVRNAWGNHAPAVSASDVGELREATQADNGEY
jgi:mono/diheme cytochrome c family protein